MVNPQIQSDPIYSLPHLYLSGLTVSVPVVAGGGATSTLLAIAPGQARDMNDNIDMPVGFPDLQGNTQAGPLFINSAVTGANGLDAGSLGASFLYSVWLIGDSRGYNPVAGLVSLSSNAYPLLPLGYDSMRLLATVSTTAGSVFDVDTVLMYRNPNVHYLQPAVSVLASAAGDTSFHAIDMTPPLPASPAAGIALLTVNYTPAAVGDTVVFRPSGSTATAGLVTITGVAAGVAQQSLIQVAYAASATSNIDYKCSSASDGLSVLVRGYILPA